MVSDFRSRKMFIFYSPSNVNVPMCLECIFVLFGRDLGVFVLLLLFFLMVFYHVIYGYYLHIFY